MNLLVLVVLMDFNWSIKLAAVIGSMVLSLTVYYILDIFFSDWNLKESNKGDK